MKRLIFLVLLSSFTFLGVLGTSAQTILTSLDGTRIDVENQRGKVVVLAIGASWLPLSGKQAEFTNTLAKKYNGKNVVVYFVATDSANAKSKNFASMDAMQRFAAASKLNVPILRDPDGLATLKKFKIDQVPTFVILDKNGNVAAEQFGGITTDAKYDVTVPIAKVIDRLL